MARKRFGGNIVYLYYTALIKRMIEHRNLFNLLFDRIRRKTFESHMNLNDYADRGHRFQMHKCK